MAPLDAYRAANPTRRSSGDDGEEDEEDVVVEPTDPVPVVTDEPVVDEPVPPVS